LHQLSNPLLALPFEPSLEGLGPGYWDVVEAAGHDRHHPAALDPARAAGAFLH
jgi:hypothetical protein